MFAGDSRGILVEISLARQLTEREAVDFNSLRDLSVLCAFAVTVLFGNIHRRALPKSATCRYEAETSRSEAPFR
jgi:hypothetical protein